MQHAFSVQRVARRTDAAEAVATTDGGTRCGGRRATWWRRPRQGYLGAMARGRGEEGHEAGAAEELGDEDGGVALHLGAVDPLQWTGARARDACGAK